MNVCLFVYNLIIFANTEPKIKTLSQTVSYSGLLYMLYFIIQKNSEKNNAIKYVYEVSGIWARFDALPMYSIPV